MWQICASHKVSLHLFSLWCVHWKVPCSLSWLHLVFTSVIIVTYTRPTHWSPWLLDGLDSVFLKAALLYLFNKCCNYCHYFTAVRPVPRDLPNVPVCPVCQSQTGSRLTVDILYIAALCRTALCFKLHILTSELSCLCCWYEKNPLTLCYSITIALHKFFTWRNVLTTS